MKKYNILLVDDDPLILEGLGEYLETNGFEAKLYRDGESAYRAYSDGYYDLCVLDLIKYRKILLGRGQVKTFSRESPTLP